MSSTGRSVLSRPRVGTRDWANAYAAARVGVPATVFVPETAPPVKVARILAYGAEVRRVGTEYDEGVHRRN